MYEIDLTTMNVIRAKDSNVNNLSFASNDFLRQRHKKTTWILA